MCPAEISAWSCPLILCRMKEDEGKLSESEESVAPVVWSVFF